MNLQEQRAIAIRSARAQLRVQGADPATVTADGALAVLDDLLRSDPETVAAQWYESASERQMRLFEREWQQWCQEQARWGG